MSPQFLAGAFLPLITNSPIFFLGPAAVSAVSAGLGYLATGAALYAANALLKKDQKKTEDAQTSFRQATPVRKALYGKGKLSGAWIVAGVNNGTFYKLIELSSRKLTAIDEVWVSDQPVTLDENRGVLDDPWTGNLYVDWRLGEAVETHYSQIQEQLPEWDGYHRGDGVASFLALQFRDKTDRTLNRYPEGINMLYRVVARGVALYDPTDVGQALDTPAGWTWSDNSARVILDYCWAEDALRAPVSLFTTPQALVGWQAAVNDSNDAITLKAGGVEPRYRTWRTYYYNERPADVLAEMMASANARFKPTPDGGLTLEVGKWRAPTVSIPNAAILSRSNVRRGRSVNESANTILSQFPSPNHDFQAIDADPWADEDDVSERGEISVTRDFLCAPSHGQCRRLMKQAADDANPEWVGSWVLNLEGLAAYGEDVITFEDALFGINGTFRVKNFQFVFGEHSTLIGAAVDLQSTEESALTWDAATEEGTAPPVGDAFGGNDVPEPDIPTITFEEVTLSGEVTALTMVATVTDPDREDIVLEAQYSASGVDAWQPMTVTEDAYEARVSPVDDDAYYDVRVRFRSGTTVSDWVLNSGVSAGLVSPSLDFSLAGNSQYFPLLIGF